jgi:prepilin-type N-terminal cleavage/methylation domain-containing protein
MNNTQYAIRNTHDASCNTHDANAFTIAELLIVLAISGILLAAVAVAFNAAIINYSENEDIFKTINSARQALSRMTSQIRTAGYQDPNYGWLGVVYDSLDNNRCELYTPEGDHIIYEFRDATDEDYPNTLLLITDDSEYVLCDNVTDATFTKTQASDPLDAKSVQISMTVQSGNLQRTLSAAAVIRRNLD